MMTPQEHFLQLSHTFPTCAASLEAVHLPGCIAAAEKGETNGAVTRESVDRDQEKAAMATLSDLKEVKEALDAGFVSQTEYDEVKSDYLRAKKECQKLELRAKNEAFLAKKEAFEFQRKELRAKEEFQKKELRAKEEALEFPSGS